MDRTMRRRPTRYEELERGRRLSHHFRRLYQPKTTIDNNTKTKQWVYAERSRSAQPTLQEQCASKVQRQREVDRRRGMPADILDRRFFEFAQPLKPYTPRVLLINDARSIIAADRTIYQGPMFPKRLQAKTKTENETKTEVARRSSTLGVPGGHPRLTSSYSSGMPWAEASNDSSTTRSSATSSPVDLDDVDQNGNKTKSTSAIDAQMAVDVVIRAITREVVDNTIFDEMTTLEIVARHVRRANGSCERKRLFAAVNKLLKDIGIECHDYVIVESSSSSSSSADQPSIALEGSEAAASKQDMDENMNASMTSSGLQSVVDDDDDRERVEGSEVTPSGSPTGESEEEEETGSVLTAQDIDDILDGRNISEIAAKLSSSGERSASAATSDNAYPADAFIDMASEEGEEEEEIDDVLEEEVVDEVVDESPYDRDEEVEGVKEVNQPVNEVEWVVAEEIESGEITPTEDEDVVAVAAVSDVEEDMVASERDAPSPTEVTQRSTPTVDVSPEDVRKKRESFLSRLAARQTALNNNNNE